jgi:hypothetical protein
VKVENDALLGDDALLSDFEVLEVEDSSQAFVGVEVFFYPIWTRFFEASILKLQF